MNKIDEIKARTESLLASSGLEQRGFSLAYPTNPDRMAIRYNTIAAFTCHQADNDMLVITSPEGHRIEYSSLENAMIAIQVILEGAKVTLAMLEDMMLESIEPLLYLQEQTKGNTFFDKDEFEKVTEAFTNPKAKISKLESGAFAIGIFGVDEFAVLLPERKLITDLEMISLGAAFKIGLQGAIPG